MSSFTRGAALVLGVFLAAAAAARAATCSPRTFIEAAQYPVGPEPMAVATGDFNGDTLIDIADVNRGNGTVSVVLNAGDGVFGPPIESDAGNGFYGLAAADLDDDGALDLVVGAHSGVSILLGQGDGTFADPVFYSAGNTTVTSIQTGNLDSDSTLDIVIGSGINSFGAIAVLLGDGDGTFQPATTFPAGGSVHSIALGDFDGNDIPDVVASNSPGNTISLLLGFGDGTFAAPLFFVAGTSPRFIAAGDFDGDDDDDVAVTTGSYLSVLKGNGAGSFGAALQYVVGGDNTGPLVTADFDEDGALDIAMLRDDGSFFGTAGVITIMRGDGAARFAVARTYLAGEFGGGIATADFNGDTRPDLAATDYVTSRVWVLLAGGPGRFEGTGIEDVADGIRNFAGGDFNGDMLQDLAAVNGSEVLIYLGDPAGGFHLEATYAVGGGAAYVQVVDVELDAVLDLLVSTGSGFPGLWFLKGNGDGTFTPAVDGIQTDPYSGQFVLRFFDAGPTQDLAVVHGCCGFGGIDILFGNGDGTFQPPVNIDLDATPSSIVAADFNLDVYQDLAVAVLDENRVLVLFGNGDGTFEAPVSYAVGSGPMWLAMAIVGPLNNLSLVTANYGSQSLSLLRGNGDGTFAPAKQIGLGVSPTFVGVFDFNADNVADFFTANESDNSVYLLFGSPDGTFSSPEVFETARQATYAEVAKLDGNFEPDLIVATPGSSNLTLLYNARLGGAVRTEPPVCVGSTVHLEVDASGFGPISYQWWFNGQPLVDGGPISGAQTPALTIAGVTELDAGSYQVALEDSCTTTFSDSAFLSVLGPPVAAVIDVFAGPAPGVAGLARALADPSLSYEWNAIGAVIVEGQGTNTVSFLALEPGTVTLEVSVFLAPGCDVTTTTLPVPVDYYDMPPDNPFHDDVVTIAQNGVTSGCGSGYFCATAPVTRAQMAVFLLRSLNGGDYIPPIQGPFFTDVPPGSFAADYINELYVLGVTGGCGGGNYCPGSSVSRAQMAPLILKTLFGSSYAPPAAVGIFGDVPVDAFAADYIEALYNLGISGGCSVSPLLYCPDNAVLRQQMAAFLVNAFF